MIDTNYPFFSKINENVAMSYDQIGKELGISEGMVRWIEAHALRKCARQMMQRGLTLEDLICVH